MSWHDMSDRERGGRCRTNSSSVSFACHPSEQEPKDRHPSLPQPAFSGLTTRPVTIVPRPVTRPTPVFAASLVGSGALIVVAIFLPWVLSPSLLGLALSAPWATTTPPMRESHLASPYMPASRHPPFAPPTPNTPRVYPMLEPTKVRYVLNQWTCYRLPMKATPHVLVSGECESVLLEQIVSLSAARRRRRHGRLRRVCAGERRKHHALGLLVALIRSHYRSELI